METPKEQMSIFDLSVGSTDKSKLKLKISDSLEKLNKSSLVFDDMINDYNTLYTKYINIQLMAEQNQRFNKLQLMKAQENVSKMDQAELEQAYNSLQEEFLKIKNSKDEENKNDILISEKEYIEKYKNGEISDKVVSPYIYNELKKQEIKENVIQSNETIETNPSDEILF